jgi:hypothetical protein
LDNTRNLVYLSHILVRDNFVAIMTDVSFINPVIGFV